MSAFASVVAAINADSSDVREVSFAQRRNNKPKLRGLSYALVDVIAASRNLPEGDQKLHVDRALAQIRRQIRALESRLLPAYTQPARTA